MTQRYSLQVREQNAPAAWARNYADGAAMGVQVAGAYDDVGKSLQRMGAALQKRQDEWDAARVMEANTEYQKRLAAYMHDPDTGVTNTRKLGMARGVTKQADQDFDKIARDIEDKLENDAQKGAFRDMSVRSRMPYWKQAGDFEAGEVAAYRKQVFTNALATGKDAALRDPMDDDAFDTAVVQAAQAIEAQYLGADRGVIARAKQEYASDLMVGRISQIAVNDPLFAEHMANTTAYLTAEDRAALLGKLTPQAERYRAQAASDARREAMAQTADELFHRFGLDEAGAYAEIDALAGLDSATKHDLKNAVSARMSDGRRLAHQRQDEWMTGWQDRIANATTLAQALEEVESSGADGAERQKLLDYAQRVHGTTKKAEDVQDWYNAVQSLSRGDCETAEDFIREWRGTLSDGTIKSLVNTYFVKNSGTGQRTAISAAAKKYLEQRLDDVGASLKEDPQMYAFFYDTVAREFDRLKAGAGLQEQFSAIDTATAMVVRDTNRWFGRVTTEVPAAAARQAEDAGFEWDMDRRTWVKTERDENGELIVLEYDPTHFAPEEARQGSAGPMGAFSQEAGGRSPSPAQRGTTVHQATGGETRVPGAAPVRVKRNPDGTLFDDGLPQGERQRAADAGGQNVALSMTGGVGRVTGRFRDRRAYRNGQHNGIDIAAPEGTEIRVPNFGVPLTVEKVSLNPKSGYGNNTTLAGVLSDGRKIEVMVGHMQNGSVTIRKGDVLQPGTVIGAVGNTGNTSDRDRGGVTMWHPGKSSGYHMDVKIKIDGKYIDPETLV